MAGRSTFFFGGILSFLRPDYARDAKDGGNGEWKRRQAAQTTNIEIVGFRYCQDFSPSHEPHDIFSERTHPATCRRPDRAAYSIFPYEETLLPPLHHLSIYAPAQVTTVHHVVERVMSMPMYARSSCSMLWDATSFKPTLSHVSHSLQT